MTEVCLFQRPLGEGGRRGLCFSYENKLWGEGFVFPTKNTLWGEGFVSPRENKL